jgi:hypothetical protein
LFLCLLVQAMASHGDMQQLYADVLAMDLGQ